MARLNFLTAAWMLLVLLMGIVRASPVADGEHDAPGPKKQYVEKGNRLDCPAAGGSKYTGPKGGKWGILCGWDTVSTSYMWGPFDLPFDQCIAKCGATEGCAIATYTGKCYLKKSIKKEGYIRTGRPTNKTAVKLWKESDPRVT